MLAGHADICAPGETWLMLPLVHAISGGRRKVDTPYDSILGDDALGEFVQSNLPGGWTDLQREVGMAASRVYERARIENDAKVLVDKTPRYYWIIEDLLSLIPDCRIVVLVRNPLAVLASIIRTWTKPRKVGFLKDYRADLLEAPTRLAGAREIEDPRLMSVRYEDLVAEPESHLLRIQEFIEVSPVRGLSQYQANASRLYGDPVGIHQATTTQQASRQRYLEDASASATMWRLIDDYRRALGPNLLQRLGYDDGELTKHLCSVRPAGTGLAPPLQQQVRSRPAEPLRSFIRCRRIVADAFATGMADTRRRRAA